MKRPYPRVTRPAPSAAADDYCKGGASLCPAKASPPKPKQKKPRFQGFISAPMAYMKKR